MFTLRRAGHLSVSRARTEVQCLGDRASAKSTTTPPRLSLKTVPSFLIFLLSFPLFFLPSFSFPIYLLRRRVSSCSARCRFFFREAVTRFKSSVLVRDTCRVSGASSFSSFHTFFARYWKNNGRILEERKNIVTYSLSGNKFLFRFILFTNTWIYANLSSI